MDTVATRKILAVGEDARELARDLYEQSEIDTTTLTPGKRRTDYDAVFSYMALQRVPYREVERVAKSWVAALRQGGELVLLVPSLEWAATQILTPNPNPALIIHLFGAQDSPQHFNASGFTLMDLRALCSRIGIAVTHASTGEYMIGDHPCEMHSLRGIKK